MTWRISPTSRRGYSPQPEIAKRSSARGRVRIGRMADPVALCKVLESEPARNARLELVFHDGSRCEIAKCIDEATLGWVIDGTGRSTDPWLELVFVKPRRRRSGEAYGQ